MTHADVTVYNAPRSGWQAAQLIYNTVFLLFILLYIFNAYTDATWDDGVYPGLVNGL